MKNEINIIRADRSMAELIADLSRVTFRESFQDQNKQTDMDKFMNEQFTREALIDEVGTPGNEFFLALRQDEPIGYARVRLNNNPPELHGRESIEIARLYVLQDKTGGGVGGKLMQVCFDYGREQKKDLAWLGVWEHNTRAIKFYTRWGFSKFAEHDFILGDDVQLDWLMKADI